MQHNDFCSISISCSSHFLFINKRKRHFETKQNENHHFSSKETYPTFLEQFFLKGNPSFLPKDSISLCKHQWNYCVGYRTLQLFIHPIGTTYICFLQILVLLYTRLLSVILCCSTLSPALYAALCIPFLYSYHTHLLAPLFPVEHLPQGSVSIRNSTDTLSRG